MSSKEFKTEESKMEELAYETSDVILSIIRDAEKGKNDWTYAIAGIEGELEALKEVKEAIKRNEDNKFYGKFLSDAINEVIHNRISGVALVKGENELRLWAQNNYLHYVIINEYNNIESAFEIASFGTVIRMMDILRKNEIIK